MPICWNPNLMQGRLRGYFMKNACVKSGKMTPHCVVKTHLGPMFPLGGLGILGEGPAKEFGRGAATGNGNCNCLVFCKLPVPILVALSWALHGLKACCRITPLADSSYADTDQEYEKEFHVSGECGPQEAAESDLRKMWTRITVSVLQG